MAAQGGLTKAGKDHKPRLTKFQLGMQEKKEDG